MMLLMSVGSITDVSELVTLDDDFSRRSFVFCLKNVLGLVVVGGRVDQEHVRVALLDQLVLVVALQLLRTLQPAETLRRSRQFNIKASVVLLVHLYVTQRRQEVQGKF